MIRIVCSTARTTNAARSATATSAASTADLCGLTVVSGIGIVLIILCFIFAASTTAAAVFAFVNFSRKIWGGE